MDRNLSGSTVGLINKCIIYKSLFRIMGDINDRLEKMQYIVTTIKDRNKCIVWPQSYKDQY